MNGRNAALLLRKDCHDAHENRKGGENPAPLRPEPFGPLVMSKTMAVAMVILSRRKPCLHS